MAQIRGSWFACLRLTCGDPLIAELRPRVSLSTRKIFESADPQAWFDEGHAVAIYDAIIALRDAHALRAIAHEATLAAMKGPWREMASAMLGLLGGSPRMAFEQLPLLWNATRRDAGEVRCLESSTRHAVTELSGFAYLDHPAWRESWLAAHEALLTRLQFRGDARTDAAAGAVGRYRVRVDWETSRT